MSSFGSTLSDTLVLAERSLLRIRRQPDLLVGFTIQPVMFVLLFVYVFGGAFELILPPSVPYVDFLMPGIFVQTAIFAATQTGVGLADDLQKGLIDRFRSLPMARSAVLAGRTAADTVSVFIQTILMLIVAYLVGYRLHEGGFEALLAFIIVVAVGYAFTWVSAFAGLSLKTIEAVQAALFTIVFPFVFVSTAFVPLATFPSWLQPFAEYNPVTIWVDTVRVLTLGDLYSPATSPLFADVKSLGTLMWLSTLWFAGFLAFFSFLGVRWYRRT
jgi:ABC-2 type transport system permease protein/oleandomycin transport system permease protein